MMTIERGPGMQGGEDDDRPAHILVQSRAATAVPQRRPRRAMRARVKLESDLIYPLLAKAIRRRNDQTSRRSSCLPVVRRRNVKPDQGFRLDAGARELGADEHPFQLAIVAECGSKRGLHDPMHAGCALGRRLLGLVWPQCAHGHWRAAATAGFPRTKGRRSRRRVMLRRRLRPQRASLRLTFGT